MMFKKSSRNPTIPQTQYVNKIILLNGYKRVVEQKLPIIENNDSQTRSNN